MTNELPYCPGCDTFGDLFNCGWTARDPDGAAYFAAIEAGVSHEEAARVLAEADALRPTIGGMMPTITVTIGRNVGTTPLGPHRWAGFVDSLTTLIEGRAEQVFVYAPGRGTWDGTGEDNLTIVASIGTPSLRTLPAALGRLAATYQQDAIALTIGETTLIGPTTN